VGTINELIRKIEISFSKTKNRNVEDEKATRWRAWGQRITVRWDRGYFREKLPDIVVLKACKS
jgi:hypothetical protein